MKLRRRISYLFMFCICMAVLSCSPFTAVNKPIELWTEERDLRVVKQTAIGRSPELLVMVAFSGGGTRAAAFAYGVLEELAKTRVSVDGRSVSLLHEIDEISSVSGGSFTAAYFGLHGEGIFTDFEDRFLRKNVQGALIGSIINPVNWIRRMSPSFGKADLVAEYYDKHIFDNATFGDFSRAHSPLIIINATELATGTRFPFTQPMFDLICSNIESYPISRAVTASSAVPVLFSPITLKNYAGTCGYEAPAWMEEAANDAAVTSRKVDARNLRTYLDSEKRPWFHLVDGGISDNLGLREFYDIVNLMGDPETVLSYYGIPKPSQILIISVDSRAQADTRWALQRYAPSMSQVLGSVTATSISRYSNDTIDIVRHSYQNWANALSTPEKTVTFNFVEVSFDAVEDKAEREYLHGVGTSFNLSDEEVDRLIAAGRKVLRSSAEFKAFLDRKHSSY